MRDEEGEGVVQRFMHKLTRKKEIDDSATELHRCLGVLDLVMMGIGSMVGSGIYFLVGQTAKNQAGPAIVVSFLLAGVVIFLAATCYMEFAARVPKTGSIYVYMYMSLGEFMAFLAGWCALMGIISGGATNGRAWSAYLDSVFHHAISNFTQNNIADWSTVGEPISTYPDFVAAAIILFMTVVVASGANFSAKFNAVFAGINTCILLFCVVVGFIYGDVKNWTEDGYFPFGWSGVIKGASSCFWAFTGFEIIATSVEEAKNPKRSVPIAIGSALSIVAVLYVSTGAALTYVTSYKNLNELAPLPSAFQAQHLQWAYYIVSIGPLCGLTTTLFSSLYGFVRITYAMAQDGLVFPCCGVVNKCTKVPVLTTVIGGSIMATIACFIDIENIISFGVIVALMQFILVDICVIILRYRPSNENVTHIKLPSDEDLNAGVVLTSPYQWKISKFRETAVLSNGLSESMNNLLDDENAEVSDAPSNRDSITSDTLDNLESVSQASIDLEELHRKYEDTGTLKPAFDCLKPCLEAFVTKPGHCVFVAVLIVTLCLALVAMLMVHADGHLEQRSWWTWAVLVALCATVSLLLFVINAHRQNPVALTLKVPCLPWLPASSLFLCLLLMISAATPVSWLVFLVILALGMVVYFSYGIRHSALNKSHVPERRFHGDTRALLDDVSDDEF